MQATTFKEAIDNKRFLEAEDIVKRGDDILKSQWQFKLSDAYRTIIQNEAYHLLDVLIEHDHIELDIFEYDNFRGSIFSALIQNTTANEATLNFLSNFIPKVDNLNDSLEDNTWLSTALSECADLKIIQTLVDCGCDINYTNNYEQTFLHLILGNRFSTATPDTQLEYIQLCIDNGLDVNKKDVAGNTPLHMAISTKSKNCFEILLDNGADPNALNNKDENAYSITLLEQLDLDTMIALNNYVPIELTIDTKRNRSLFYEYINSFHGDNISEKEQNIISFFIENGADPTQENTSEYGAKETVLDLVVKKSFEFFTRFFDIFTMDDVNASDNNGNTLLHKICAIDVNFEVHKAKDIYRKVKALIKLGADISLTNNQDKTAMMLASNDNLKEKTVALLLKN